MSLLSDVVVFFCLWWIVLFTVLPWGAEADPNPEVGHARSAPLQPRLVFKFMMTTIITTILWAIVHVVMTHYVYG
jgi:predicted secreted protein